MKVEIIKKKGSALPGDVIDIDALDGERLIKSGHAKAVEPEVSTDAEEEEGVKSIKKPKK